jgi:hypothetical protein
MLSSEGCETDNAFSGDSDPFMHNKPSSLPDDLIDMSHMDPSSKSLIELMAGGQETIKRCPIVPLTIEMTHEHTTHPRSEARSVRRKDSFSPYTRRSDTFRRTANEVDGEAPTGSGAKRRMRLSPVVYAL